MHPSLGMLPNGGSGDWVRPAPWLHSCRNKQLSIAPEMCWHRVRRCCWWGPSQQGAQDPPQVTSPKNNIPAPGEGEQQIFFLLQMSPWH